MGFHNSELLLCFWNPEVLDPEAALSGVMARLHIDRPLFLGSEYLQAMISATSLIEKPRNIYILGVGAGRAAMVLTYMFAESAVIGSEIDTDVIELAYSYFGLIPSSNLSIANRDGFLHLGEQKDGDFDYLLIDCYGPDGLIPSAFTTGEFFELVRRKLTQKGIVVMNLVLSDPSFEKILSLFETSFQTTATIPIADAVVLVGFQQGGVDKSAAKEKGPAT